jgi:hypothetical protein
MMRVASLKGFIPVEVKLEVLMISAAGEAWHRSHTKCPSLQAAWLSKFFLQ